MIKKLKSNNIIIALLIVVALLVVGLLASLSLQSSRTGNDIDSREDIAAIFADETIRLIVPTAPGGGFDEYGRLLAPYLEKYTGSRVRIVNMPGAGGLLAVNEMSNSPPDGLTLTLMNGSGMISNRLAGIEGAKYGIEELEYIGRMVANTRVLSVSVNSGYESIDDVWNNDEVIKLGATGLGASGYVDGVIANEAFGFNFQIIPGFDAFPVVRQAMVRGDLAGAWTSWSTARDAYDAGLERVILQSGRERNSDIPDVPTVFEYIDRTDDPDRTTRILTAWNALNAVGRPIATTPGTPEGRVDFLRSAFRQAMEDPDFLNTARDFKRPVHYASGEETLDIIRTAIEMDEDIEDLFVKLIRGEVN